MILTFARVLCRFFLHDGHWNSTTTSFCTQGRGYTVHLKLTSKHITSALPAGLLLLLLHSVLSTRPVCDDVLQALARHAASLVVVEYGPPPDGRTPIITIQQAVAAGAFYDDSVLSQHGISSCGDVAAAMGSAAHTITAAK
jgi:hypothetical protein